MAESKRKFSGRLFGYSKKQVNEAMESAGREISELKAENEARDLRIAELSRRIADLEAENDSLTEEAAAARREKEAIAKVLVDAQRRGDEIVDTAVKNAESETARLSVHADKVRSKIEHQVKAVKDIEDASYDYVRAIIDQLKASADKFEQDVMDTVDESRRSTDVFLDETEAVLDVDYFADAGVDRSDRQDVGDAPAAPEDIGETEKAGETPENASDVRNEVKDEMPPFQSSDEAAAYFKVIRA